VNDLCFLTATELVRNRRCCKSSPDCGEPGARPFDDAVAESKRTALYHRVRQFMERHDFLVLPVTQVPPFDVTQGYVTEIEGVRLPTYIDWMRVCSDITVTGLPAISVPCGFTDDGLPVGIQIVGRHQDDWGVLQLAHAFEQATEAWRRRPPDAAMRQP
jgi:amidase